MSEFLEYMQEMIDHLFSDERINAPYPEPVVIVPHYLLDDLRKVYCGKENCNCDKYHNAHMAYHRAMMNYFGKDMMVDVYRQFWEEQEI